MNKNTKPRIIFIHGNGATHWSYTWSPWLKTQLENLGYPTFFETFPDSVIARESYWLPFLEKHVRAGENDVIVGRSSGAVAAMRYAETHKIKGSILVSPSYTDLGDDLEEQSGYFDKPWDWDKIRSNQEKIALFYSDNDPYIPIKDFKFIISQLKPTEIMIPGQGHFSDRGEFPEIIDYIESNY